jgi:hypothetical protein
VRKPQPPASKLAAMHTRCGLFVAITLALALHLPSVAALAAESAASRLATVPVEREQLASNLESVGKLLSSSSAARQIEASRSAEALTRRDRALELHANARTALEGGDLPRAAALLTEARSIFFDAVRMAAPEEVLSKKLESDYRNRLDSVKALLAAYQRVAIEKSDSSRGVRETVAQVERSMAEAAKLAQAGKYQQGRGELDRAYLVAKAAVSGLRSGDTLVRSLSFASKEEEYHYEIDRNNTHQMLIRILIEERKAADDAIQRYMAQAQQLRTRAEEAAVRRDFGDAVKLLEDSTAELVRAIRNAGIYIPG